MRWPAILAAAAASGVLLSTALQAASPRGEAPSSPKAVLGDWGFDLDTLDRSVDPGADFFRFANGKWLASAKIPDDRPVWGPFAQLRVLSEERLITIIHGIDAAPAGTNPQKIRDLYAGYVDQGAIEKRGLTPARSDLARIGGLATLDDVARAMGDVRLGAFSIIGSRVEVDAKDSGRYAVRLSQSGLGLPNRDYYLRDDEKFAEFRRKYRDCAIKFFELASIEGGAAKADAILALETRIAKAQWPIEKVRDDEATYNPRKLEDLTATAPGFPWAVYLESLGVGGRPSYIVSEPDSFAAFARIFRSTPVATWRDYMTFHYLHSMASCLPKAFDDTNFEFFSKTLQGQQVPRSRDKRGTSLVDGLLGEAVGQMYVDRYFTPQAKAQANELIANLRTAFAERIKQLDWMSDETKVAALAKLDKFTVKIGYPDKWIDYSAYEVRPGDLVGNVQRGREFEWKRVTGRLDSPVDRSEWQMTPQTVNAYNEPTLNEIVFPAAILQPPFFDPNADPAVNYGAIGAVIGHEIGHGFDDQGSKYDGQGELRNWWTDADRTRFDKRGDELVAQYGKYSPVEGVNVNGRLTLGENIGDLGGLSMAYAAYQLSLHGKPAPVLDGFTGEQRFFLGFAQIWRVKARDDFQRQLVLSDPHSPAEFRVNGTIRNFDAWYKAFKVEPADGLYLKPEARVSIW
jgi:predicted metalloendopeptidase